MATALKNTVSIKVPTWQWHTGSGTGYNLINNVVIGGYSELSAVSGSYLCWIELQIFLAGSLAPGGITPQGEYNKVEWYAHRQGASDVLLWTSTWPDTSAFTFNTWYILATEIDWENGTVKYWIDGTLKLTQAVTVLAGNPNQTETRLSYSKGSPGAVDYDFRWDNWSETKNGAILHQDAFTVLDPALWNTSAGGVMAIAAGEVQATESNQTGSLARRWVHNHGLVESNMAIASDGNQSGNPYRQLFGCYVDSGSNVFQFRRNIAGEPFDETDTGIDADEASIERKSDGTLILSAVASNVITNYQSRNQGATWVVV